MGSVWACSEVYGWTEESCCRLCHEQNKASFLRLLNGTIVRVCCRYASEYIRLHSKENIEMVDAESYSPDAP